MSGYIILAVLAITPGGKYKSPAQFLKAHNVTIEEVCKRYHAKKCFIREEANGTMDALGFTLENGTYSWTLYGKK